MESVSTVSATTVWESTPLSSDEEETQAEKKRERGRPRKTEKVVRNAVGQTTHVHEKGVSCGACEEKKKLVKGQGTDDSSKKRRFNCCICNKKFESTDARDEHVAEVHPSEISSRNRTVAAKRNSSGRPETVVDLSDDEEEMEDVFTEESFQTVENLVLFLLEGKEMKRSQLIDEYWKTMGNSFETEEEFAHEEEVLLKTIDKLHHADVIALSDDGNDPILTIRPN